MTTSTLSAAFGSVTFSGHETFVLRSNWLKKAYDLLQECPDLFSREDSFVRLGVGKNMAHSIRFWGRVCGVFVRVEGGTDYQATQLGRAILADAGWDPFLVTPASRWLLHWQLVARPETAFTWHYAFNLLRRGEFTTAQLAQQITQFVAQHGGKAPSAATLGRDIDCMLRCYLRPNAVQLGPSAEDVLHCPLNTLNLLQLIPDQGVYRVVTGARPDLPDQLVAFAALQQARFLGRATVAFNELAYGVRSPGRIFRLDEDALYARLLRLEAVTEGQVSYTETGGIRQIAWRNLQEEALDLDQSLLAAAFAQEGQYV
ncbi:MAG: DUF4007 family protein [Candidatus Viridilinea halotolerans]|uniref:DUF4007 family protein n=1 Tax=Candidatus Viridilinea halotolerans TaxID=2491704 RepID=A0A426TQM9_9CHLR|nr:MAG: DUF4007 family protein [Candidatus Viridilinea halotolerans]